MQGKQKANLCRLICFTAPQLPDSGMYQRHNVNCSKGCKS